MNISYIIPAYNCENTIKESIDSIFEGNFKKDDELVVVDDHSSDETLQILYSLKSKYKKIKILVHDKNLGSAWARNTAVLHSKNELIFCLDSDNLLETNSVHKLYNSFNKDNSDSAAFQEVWYFKSNNSVTHKWQYPSGVVSIEDYLSTPIVPGSSGNYLFTKDSWYKVGGYPQVKTLDTWGFGFRQQANGIKHIVVPNTYYYHRWGHQSNYVRESKKRNHSLIALEIILPYINLLYEYDIKYMLKKENRENWFYNLDKHPIRVKGLGVGRQGLVINLNKNLEVHKNYSMIQNIISKFIKLKN